VSDITGEAASCNMEKRGESQYEISYQPKVRGKHKIQGQRIKDSPFSVTVNSPVKQIGTPILISYR